MVHLNKLCNTFHVKHDLLNGTEPEHIKIINIINYYSIQLIE